MVKQKPTHQNENTIFVTSIYYTGLTCYSCNTDGAGIDCIDDPNKYTTVNCVKDEEGNIKDYCYTTRIEDTDPDTEEPSKYFQTFNEIKVKIQMLKTSSMIFIKIVLYFISLISGVTVDRSCCHPTELNSICPIGDDFQVVTTDVYTKYLTRCQGDLCNDGPGDNSDDADNGGKYLVM